MPYTVDPSDIANPSDDDGATQGAEELRRLKKFVIARSFTSLADAPYNCPVDGTDATPQLVDAIGDMDAAGGGIIFLPGRGRIYGFGDVEVPNNVWIMGEANKAVYDSNSSYYVYGTRIKPIAGATWVFALTGRYGRLSNMHIAPFGGAGCPWGVIRASGALASIVEHISVLGLEYGFAGAGLNSDMFWGISAIACTKGGFVVLQPDDGAVGTYQYPNIQTLITGLGSTVFTIAGRSVFRENKIGMIFRDGIGMNMKDSVIESNQQAAIMGFKSAGGNLDNFEFQNVHFENNYFTGAPVPSVNTVEVLRTGAGAGDFLVGDVSGAYAGADNSYDLWLGSANEGYTVGFDGAKPNTYVGGSPANWRFINCWMGPNLGLARMRSSRYFRFEDCHMQSQTATGLFSAGGPSGVNFYKAKFIRPRSYGRDPVLFGMQVPGRYHTYQFDEAPITDSLGLTASGTWITMCDLSLMTEGAKYEFIANISASAANWPLYGAMGYAWKFPGAATYQIIYQKAPNAGSAEVQITAAGLLQYRQLSGAPATIDYKVNYSAPLEPIN